MQGNDTQKNRSSTWQARRQHLAAVPSRCLRMWKALQLGGFEHWWLRVGLEPQSAPKKLAVYLVYLCIFIVFKVNMASPAFTSMYRRNQHLLPSSGNGSKYHVSFVFRYWLSLACPSSSCVVCAIPPNGQLRHSSWSFYLSRVDEISFAAEGYTTYTIL